MKDYDNNNLLNSLNEQDESADYIEGKLSLTNENKLKAGNTIYSFVKSYKNKSENQSANEWLTHEFNKYPDLWLNLNESSKAAKTVVDSVKDFEDNMRSLEGHLNKGYSKESWLAKQMDAGAKASGIINVSKYAQNIDEAIISANQKNIDLIYRNDGQVNQQLNLDGFIAEHHHVNEFNLDAASKNSNYEARVLEPAPGEVYAKNSVDIGIYDKSSGKLVKRYQSKYGADSKATEKQLKDGDYRGQKALVPKDQSKDIDGSTEVIEIDGIKSKPLSKEKAKELQKEAQEKEIAKKYDWNDANKIDIAKQIGKSAAISACISVGLQGGRILGRRIWNKITGQENESVDDDLQEFVSSSIQSAKDTGIAVAVTGGVTVAIKSGWLGSALKATPVGRIANAVCVGIENVKVLSRYAKGEITGIEAIDQSANVTISTVGAIAAGTKGAALGASIGTALGPIGTVIGGIAGGILGGMAGSTAGDLLYQGGKKIVSSVASGIKSLGSSVVSGVSSFCSGVSSTLSSLCPW